MINRGKDADRQHSHADLKWRGGKPGADGRKANPDEEDRHHAVTAPPVSQPAHWNGGRAKGKNTERAVNQQIVIGKRPFILQGEHDRRIDQNEHVIEEMADIEEHEMFAHGIAGAPLVVCSRSGVLNSSLPA